MTEKALNGAHTAAGPLHIPAHDFVGEQHSTHLRILVLSLVDYGLVGRSEHISTRESAVECHIASGAEQIVAPKVLRVAIKIIVKQTQSFVGAAADIKGTLWLPARSLQSNAFCL